RAGPRSRAPGAVGRVHRRAHLRDTGRPRPPPAPGSGAPGRRAHRARGSDSSVDLLVKLSGHRVWYRLGRPPWHDQRVPFLTPTGRSDRSTPHRSPAAGLPVARITVAVMLLVLALTGCSVRLDTPPPPVPTPDDTEQDRKSTRLNSSHVSISYAVLCLNKKNNNKIYSLLTCIR